MEQGVISIENLTPLHWVLAYTGLLVHVFMKIANCKGNIRGCLTRKFIMTSIASILIIPAILLICTDTGMKDLLPINYLTAFLSGYQTQSMIANISALTKKQYHESNES